MIPMSRRVKRLEDWMAECQRHMRGDFPNLEGQQRTFDAKIDGLTYDAKNQEFISPGMLPLALHEMQTVIDQLKSDVQHYKAVNFEQFEKMRGYIDKLDHLKESKDALASIHSSVINKNEEQKAELEEFRKRSVSSWKADREKDIELSSLKYQSKQGVAIRAALEERINVLVAKNKSQSEYIKTLIAKVDAKDDTIKEIRDATVNNEELEFLRNKLVNYAYFIDPTSKIVHVLMYRYKKHHQEQLAGVFTTQAEVDKWLDENPAARDEETEIYTYKLNQGEL